MSDITTLIRSINTNDSITVDGPATITVGKSRRGRALLIIRAPRSTTISNSKHAKPVEKPTLLLCQPENAETALRLVHS